MDYANQPKPALPADKVVIFKLHGGQNDGDTHRSDMPETASNSAREMWGISRGATIGHTFGFGSERFGNVIREESGGRPTSEGIERAIEKQGVPPLHLYKIESVREEGNQIIAECQYAGARAQNLPKA